jgi:phosphonate transport system substrate-binding protein
MKRSALALIAVFGLVLTACGTGGDATTTTGAPTTTEAPGTTGDGSDVGSEANPIQVLFVPSVAAEEIIAGGELLQAALETATGLHFEVSVPNSYAAGLEEMCASPESTMGVIPAQAYVLGNTSCGIEVALKSLRFGFTEYWTEFIVPRDSDVDSIEDLAGLSWAYPDTGSTSGYLVPQGMFLDMGLEPGETVETGGHNQVVEAVYNGSADFGTTFFSPSVNGAGEVVWDGTPEDADVPDELVPTCALDAEGEILCGDDLYPRDARRNIREAAPDVIQGVRILTLSEPIPNDTLSYSPDFPDELAGQINDAIKAFAEDDPEGFASAFEAYSWSGVADTNDAEFDSIRAIVEALGLTPDDL